MDASLEVGKHVDEVNNYLNGVKEVRDDSKRAIYVTCGRYMDGSDDVKGDEKS